MSMIGQILDHYSVSTLLGKGGMGEVYQAKDQKLGRDVAIKVLPEEFAKDADRVARFQREAKLLASLNHPNIAAIYGLEESKGTHFLVLELIEGETLADRLKRGAIAVEESLKLALQIAEALESAHEKGVIHRDLKPANIKITPDGKVKVLDFGLAKAYAGEQEDVNLSNSPTLSAAATQQGIILGTAAYMSPEQARGKTVDKRADIWAFGVVLYEMLTGQSAFQGEDVSVTLASVIKGDTNLTLLPPNIHPRVREVIGRCLQNDIRKRYSGIADARYEIEQALSDPGGLLVQPASTGKERTALRQMATWIVAIALTAIIAGIAVWNLKPTKPRRIMRFDYELPEGQQLDGSGHPFLAISPDGSKFVYNTDKGIYLRSMDQPVARLIMDADKRPRQPFFSPDGQWVGYWCEAENQLKKIAINGGAPVTLARTGNPGLANWGVDDTIVYVQWGTGRIMRVSANGGIPELLCETKGKQIFAPQILPDDKSVLFTQMTGPEYQVVVHSLKSGQDKPLMTIQGTVSRYLPTGHIAYMVGNDLFAVPFDPDRLEVTGGPVSMVEGILWMGANAAPQYAVSDSGTLVYVLGAPKRMLVWVDRSGTESAIGIAPLRTYVYPRISPDGERVALDVRDQDIGIFTWDFARESLSQFTFGIGAEYYPFWSPDGKYIAFESLRAGEVARIYRKASNNPTSADEPLTEKVNLSTEINGYCFTPDNKSLVFRQQSSVEKGDNIGMISLNGDSQVTWLLDAEYNERNAELSPDGNWIAYQSDQSGEYEIYVRPFPNVNEQLFQISNNGGEYPLWSRNGDELFYIAPGNPPHMVAVSIDTGSGFDFETPEELFEWRYFTGNGGRTYDVSLDGKRFLVIDASPAGEDTNVQTPRIGIVVNWFEELKERVRRD